MASFGVAAGPSCAGGDAQPLGDDDASADPALAIDEPQQRSPLHTGKGEEEGGQVMGPEAAARARESASPLPGEKKQTITFIDYLGRTNTFPYEIAKTWTVRRPTPLL